MTVDEFIDLYYGKNPGSTEDSTDTAPINESEDNVTHPIADNGKKHPKIACAWDAMGPLAGSGESGPMDGLADGEGAGVGEGAPAGGMGESITPKGLNACLEAIAAEHPESEAIPQILSMFNEIATGKRTMPLYCGADGCSTCTPADCMASECDSAIATASASVEAALMTFKKVAGYDYPGIIKR